MSPTPDFSRRASTYDELRPTDENWWEVYEALVREGDLAGRRVLDVGCGTGRFAAALTESHSCTVIGVDPSPGMLAVARARTADVTWLEGRAEALPLGAGAVERAFLQTVVHLIE